MQTVGSLHTQGKSLHLGIPPIHRSWIPVLAPEVSFAWGWATVPVVAPNVLCLRERSSAASDRLRSTRREDLFLDRPSVVYHRVYLSIRRESFLSLCELSSWLERAAQARDKETLGERNIQRQLWIQLCCRATHTPVSVRDLCYLLEYSPRCLRSHDG